MSSTPAVRVLVLLSWLTTAGAAQATGGSLSGTVYDSIARRPLPGALVQVVAVEGARHFSNSTITDSLGRYRLSNVPGGRFMLGFLHPLLDSLGIEPLLHEVAVEANRHVRADLAVPSPARMRAAICGAPDDSSRGGAVIGVVRDARDRAPVAGVAVTAEWLELSLGREGMTGTIASQVDTTRDNGWFAVCNVPSPGTLLLVAARGADSTDRVELDLSSASFARRELYIGVARTVTTGDSVRRAQRAGDGRLRGVVVAAGSGRPLAGAQVGVVDGAWTTANDRGEWILDAAPTGTRILQVRAVGYYPHRIAVDVVSGGHPLTTALPTMQSVLDTVRITASRLTRVSRGFEERRRASNGKFITQEDVIRRHPLVTSDMFYRVAGLQVEQASNPIDGKRIYMRGLFSDRCFPAIYIDGMYMSDLSANDIDGMVRPDEVAGIEVYSGAWVPAQFTRGLAGVGHVGEACGSIVIWTRPSPTRPKRLSWWQRTFTLLGAGALAVLIGSTANHW
ncbi:MAG TPA: carboxypeptidase regulatory-like domain-containing protein [Gemmatimonadaceae bacterium]